MALDTVGDYLTEARVLLQDSVVPYRYSDAELKNALGYGIYEMRRVRPDLFVGSYASLPSIGSATSSGTAVAVDPQFRLSLVFFVVGHVGLREEEESSGARATGFHQMFLAKLLSVAA